MAKTNKGSATLDKFVHSILQGKKYNHVLPGRFEAAFYLEQPIYTTKFTIGETIYDTSLEADFIIYHPVKWPKCLVIKTRWQETGGTVDEKFPYLVQNIKKKQSYRTIIILGGGGHRKGAEKWLKLQVNNRLLNVFNEDEFLKWVSKNNI